LVDENNIEYLPLRRLLDNKDFSTSIVLSVGLGENLPLIAGLVLGNEDLWWIIADYNNIRDPLNLKTGQIIYIPTLTEILPLLSDINLK